MIGEFEFETLFTDHQDPSLAFDSQENIEGAQKYPFPIISSIVFIFFIIIMSIIIMNLMVGLAVDDIKTIQDCAEFQKLSLTVSHCTILYIFVDYLYQTPQSGLSYPLKC